MASLSGSEVALMESRFGKARFGAARFGYFTPYPFVSIGGTDVSDAVDLSTIAWTQNIDDKDDVCKFKMSNTGVDPVGGVGVTAFAPKVVKLAVGAADRFVFAGPIQKVTVKNASPGQDAFGRLWDIEARDYTRDLRRMLVTKRYTSESASDIALDLLTAGAAPVIADDASRVFTGNNIQAGLATVGEITFKYTSVDKALTRLAARVDAYWYVDADADLHFFTSESLHAARDLDADDAGYWDLAMVWDDSNSITKGIVEFKGSAITAQVTVGDSTVPVEEGDIFSTSGTAILGSDIFSWSGKSTDTLTGVIWADSLATNYEKGEYVGQIAPGTPLPGSPGLGYQRTRRFRRDRRMTSAEAVAAAADMARDVQITGTYKTNDPNALIGAPVTIDRATSHMSTAGSSETGRIVVKQTTKWKSRKTLERSVEVGVRARRVLRTFFGKVGDEGAKD